MAGISNIKRPPVSFTVRHLSKSSLLQLIEEHKCNSLVLEQSLMKPVARVCGATILKQNGIERFFKLSDVRADKLSSNSVLYVVRPTIENMRIIASHVIVSQNDANRKFVVGCVPQKSLVGLKVLEEEGAIGNTLHIEDLPIDFIPLDDDVLTLAMPEFFPDFYLNNDYSCLMPIASALVNLQDGFGKYNKCMALGEASKFVLDMMKDLMDNRDQPRPARSEIGRLVLLDRAADLITPMLSQIAFEGILDDVIGIEYGDIRITMDDKVEQMLLNDENTVFSEIRDSHFTSVFSVIRTKAKKLQEEYEKGRKQDISGTKQFVQNLPELKTQHRTVAMMVSASEYIHQMAGDNFQSRVGVEYAILEGDLTKSNITYIEDTIAKQDGHWSEALRLISLLSLVQDGIKPGDLRSLKTQFVHGFGFEHIATFHNLKRAGFITEQSSSSVASAAIAQLGPTSARKSKYFDLSKRLKLITKNRDAAATMDLRHPTSMSYVFNGVYSPISCRLIEEMLYTGQNKISLDTLGKMLNLPYSEKTEAQSVRPGSITNHPEANVVLVCFLGGCTFSEIAALRFLGKVKGYTFIIVTTAIATGKRLLQSISNGKT